MILAFDRRLGATDPRAASLAPTTASSAYYEGHRNLSEQQHSEADWLQVEAIAER
jgi:hypothetical protein